MSINEINPQINAKELSALATKSHQSSFHNERAASVAVCSERSTIVEVTNCHTSVDIQQKIRCFMKPCYPVFIPDGPCQPHFGIPHKGPQGSSADDPLQLSVWLPLYPSLVEWCDYAIKTELGQHGRFSKQYWTHCDGSTISKTWQLSLTDRSFQDMVCHADQSTGRHV